MTEHDEDGFPVINDDTIGTLFTNEYGVVYVCEWIEDLQVFGWRALGKG